MFEEIFLAVIQAVTEFLPISSSGHLALVSNLISEPNLFFITALHLASLLAVLIFTRKEIFSLLEFDKKANKKWLYLIVATIPAAIVGLVFKDLVEKSLSSYLFLGIAFLFTGGVILLTKNFESREKIGFKNVVWVGVFQAVAIFPGVSRSGMTISSGIFSGMDRQESAKFSFLLFIPLAIGAFILEIGEFYFNLTLLVSFIVCFILSYIFLNILFIILKHNKFWMFSFYCFLIGIVSLVLHFI